MLKLCKRNSPCVTVALSFFLIVLLGAMASLAGAQTAITTYHYDNYRTGWNQNETTLTPANVKNKIFGRLHTVTLDDQVDAQPLVVPGVQITAEVFRARMMWSMWRQKTTPSMPSMCIAGRCCSIQISEPRWVIRWVAATMGRGSELTPRR